MNALLDRDARLVIGHRGAAAEAPENTLPSFALALEVGAQALELDVHLSADGEVMVVHDATLDRTTDARGPVAARTAAELARVDAGAHLPAWRGRGAHVPRLAEVLEAFPATPLLIEIKTGAVQDALARLLVAQRAVERCVVASASHEAMARFREPPFLAGASGRDVQRLFAAPLLGLPVGVRYGLLSVPWRWHGIEVPTRGFIERAGRLGAAVSVWTVDDPALAARLWARGANGIVTNDPRRVAGSRPG
ncbi:MAG TPA: glycerophosphodiester phosphodiesterase family protein [Gemmatimonadales bacterium]|nr:glycerophosphodiester phosphodiesterase family protein [Gemmatimonadales bacterium]